MNKNYSGFSAKFKEGIFVQSLIINWKVSVLNFTTILILATLSPKELSSVAPI
jgi:hypothetical protein